MELEVKTELIGNVRVVTAIGSVDAGTAEHFDSTLSPLMEGQQNPQILVDMSELAYMSSAGLRILLSAQKVARGLGGEVVLVGMQEPVQEVFAMVGFDVLFRSFPDREQALEALIES